MKKMHPPSHRGARVARALEPQPYLATFSIAARSADGASFGVAVATARPNVGSLVPFVSLRGAIATQARVNTDLGRHGQALLAAGVPLATALGALLEADAERERRQLHGIGPAGPGERFTFSGEACVAWAGHKMLEHATIAGNMLTGPEVLEAMAQAFASDVQADFAERLLRALEAGQAAGGDKRGKQSAALLVASTAPQLYHNLRSDDHAEPVAELRRIFEVVRAHARQIEAEYGPEGRALFGRVKTG